jgi:hypothetical protein
MARHKLKDDEAGGYGLGVMETRKRMWRDADGNIVTKRPTLSNNNPSAASSQGNLFSNDPYPEISGDRDRIHQYSGPLSPPTSMSSASSVKRQQQQQQQSKMNPVDDFWNPEPILSFHSGPPDMCEYLANSSWGSQSFAATPGIDDDIFNPDTGMDKPFTKSHL